jgi:hypothetical protein
LAESHTRAVAGDELAPGSAGFFPEVTGADQNGGREK